MLHDCAIRVILCRKLLSWIIVGLRRLSHLKQVDTFVEHLQRYLSIIMSGSTADHVNGILKFGVVLLLFPDHA